MQVYPVDIFTGRTYALPRGLAASHTIVPKPVKVYASPLTAAQHKVAGKFLRPRSEPVPAEHRLRSYLVMDKDNSLGQWFARDAFS